MRILGEIYLTEEMVMSRNCLYRASLRGGSIFDGHTIVIVNPDDIRVGKKLSAQKLDDIAFAKECRDAKKDEE